MIYTKLITVVSVMILFCLIVYIIDKYRYKKYKQSFYNIDKYIIQNLSEHILLCGLLLGGYTCKIEDNFLILYDKYGNERTRKPCVQNKNKSYFRYILKDSVSEIENEIKNE